MVYVYGMGVNHKMLDMKPEDSSTGHQITESGP